MRKIHSRYLGAASALAVAVALGATAASAQTATSTIRGSILDGSVAEAGATVVAREVATGYTARATARADGGYVIPGLRPGSYEVTVTTADGQTATDVVRIDVASTGTLDLNVGAAPAAADVTTTDLGDVVVTGRRLVEVRTSEVATSVSREQIETLPQTDRNFLSFARLAPGVQYNDGENSRTFQSGASTASAVNVFIDGASLKSQTLPNGVAGQDSSRGNPFAQLAVQEFRVLTQNYKAEYEQAAAAVITAVTRSGTNEFHGEVFGAYQDRDMIEDNVFDERAGREKPDYKRTQYGVALGGPIIRDRLHFFVAYEGNDQDRASTVTIGNRTPQNVALFGQYEGNFVVPFRADLFFGKLSWSMNDQQNLDFSYTSRRESDISGFGGTNSFEVAEDKRIEVTTYNLRHTYRGEGFLNEASVDYIEDIYNPTSLNPDSPTLDYRGVIRIGGRESIQYIARQGLTLRDDVTITSMENHVIKVGGKYTKSDYDFNKFFYQQPQFTFRSDVDPTYSYPQEARLGLGNPSIQAENWIVGLYAQDDWDITPWLQLNLGLRWDYEDNLFNNDYVTPANAAAALRSLPQRYGFNPEDYITDGSDRPRFKGAFQPRIGFSIDVFEDESLVVFGGYGRYYDRNIFNNTLDEQFRLQYQTGTFYFSQDGLPREGNPTVVWNESYRTREGLIALRNSAQTGLPELFAVKNNAKPPSTDQLSLGVRRRMGDWTGAVTATWIQGQNGYTHVFGTLNANGTCCDTASARSFGYANVLLGVDDLKTDYKGLYFTLDKPYNRDSGWGVNLAYTYAIAKQNGNDLFSLDYPRPLFYGMYEKNGSQHHTFVGSGIIDLPLGIRASTITTLSSGALYTVQDSSNGFGYGNQINLRGYEPPKTCLFDTFAFCNVDLKFEKDFALFGDQRFTLQLDVLNAFNNKNYSGYNAYIPPTGQTNADFGKPSSLANRPRSLQVGFRYAF